MLRPASGREPTVHVSIAYAAVTPNIPPTPRSRTFSSTVGETRHSIPGVGHRGATRGGHAEDPQLHRAGVVEHDLPAAIAQPRVADRRPRGAAHLERRHASGGEDDRERDGMEGTHGRQHDEKEAPRYLPAAAAHFTRSGGGASRLS